MESESIDLQIQLRITTQLYQHTPSAIYSTLFNVIIVAFVFRNIASPYVNFTWAGLTFLYLLWRLFFTHRVLKEGISFDNCRLRLRQFGITICLSGILFGSAGIILISPGNPAFNAFIYFLMGGMFAGSMGAFAIHRLVFFAFSTPIILPTTIHFFLLEGEINFAMGSMGIIFILMMISIVKRMNHTIVGAIRLGIENTQLAEDTKRLNEELTLSNYRFKELSYRDSLTQINNRRFINEVLSNEIERFVYGLSKRHYHYRKTPDNDDCVYGVFIIDIDHFKQVNDTWGHNCGDEMIVQFVNALKFLIRKEDVIVRWGGEEFVIILKKTNPDYINCFAEKIISTISDTHFKISEEVTISKTCSLGYTAFPFFRNHPQSMSLEQTIDIADKALYYAKTHGRNQAVRATLSTNNSSQLNHEEVMLIAGDISKAIEYGKIVLRNE